MENRNVLAALMGTTFSLAGAMYQAYLVQNKHWNISNLKRGQLDTYTGIFFLALISALVIITSAAVLHPFGIKVNSTADMALQLEAIFGNYAKIIFSLGLCAAVFSSLVVNAVLGGGLLADGFRLGRTMDEKVSKLFTTLILFNRNAYCRIIHGKCDLCTYNRPGLFHFSGSFNCTWYVPDC